MFSLALVDGMPVAIQIHVRIDFRGTGMTMSKMLREAWRAVSSGVHQSVGRVAGRPETDRGAPPTVLTVDADKLTDFLALSQFLTGKSDLNPAVGTRAFLALAEADKAFEENANSLRAAIQDGRLADMDAFDSFVVGHPDLKPTAMSIISAWYLGYTGTPAPLDGEDDARFVAYESALMFRPTADATAVPSYTHGKTGYWRHPPASLATD